MDTFTPQWATPPTDEHRAHPIYRSLRDHPGEWAVYPQTAAAARAWCRRHPAYECMEADGVVYMRHVEG